LKIQEVFAGKYMKRCNRGVARMELLVYRVQLTRFWESVENLQRRDLVWADFPACFAHAPKCVEKAPGGDTAGEEMQVVRD
jgi:hypothetical protein